MPTSLITEIYQNLFGSLVALLIIVITYLTLNLICIKKSDSKAHKRRFRIRTFYIASMVFLFIIARIWVNGFSHLLAVLGLVSAALVITNKETIMNAVGWLVITWRGLLTEEDLICIQGYQGYVKSIGFLYFTLAEVSETHNGMITGRIIRVPNGTVANNAIVNLSQTSHFLEHRCTLIVTKSSNMQAACALIEECILNVLAGFYKGNNKFSLEYIAKRNKSMASHFHMGVKTFIKPQFEKPSGIVICAQYFCFSQDAAKIEQEIWRNLLILIENNDNVKLAFA